MRCFFRESEIYAGRSKAIYYTSSGNNTLADKYIESHYDDFKKYLTQHGAGQYSLHTLPSTMGTASSIIQRSNPRSALSSGNSTLKNGSFAAIVGVDNSYDDIPVAEILFEEIPDGESVEALHTRIYETLNGIIAYERQSMLRNIRSYDYGPDDKEPWGRFKYRTQSIEDTPQIDHDEDCYVAADLIAESLDTPEEIILSDIRINENYDITLPLYPQIKIELEPLPKALYIFLLCHPDGIILKEINDYSDEFQSIYRLISGRQNWSVIKRMFERITNPTHNYLHKNLSIIRHEFLSKLRSDIAQRYMPTQGRHQKHRIPLESSKITLPTNFIYS